MKQITILLNEVDVLRPINVLQGLVGSEGHDAPRGHVSIVIDTSYLVPTFLGSSAQNLLPCMLLSDMLRFSRGDTMQISPFLEMD